MGGGDITAVTAGTGLSGGGTSGDVTLSADSSYMQRRVSGTCTSGNAIRVVNSDGTVTCEPVGGGGDAWLLTGNAGTTPGYNYLGTADNQALELKVNGQRALRLEPVGNPVQNVNVIGGCAANEVASSFLGAAIAGGGEFGSSCGGAHNQPCWNRALAGYTAVGGGLANTASGGISTVAGGQWNTASGGEAAVGGGYGNSAIGDYATVAGGFGNTAGGSSWTGDYAAVPGGFNNVAQGEYSFAAGYQAKATNQGAFVWADYTPGTNFYDTGINTFNIRADNGAYIQSDNPSYGLEVMNSGSGGNGDGVRSYANVSQGANWAAVYAYSQGSSPGVYGRSQTGTYAGYFDGQIFAAGCVGCLLIQLGVSDGTGMLQPGDLAAVWGLAEPLAGTEQPILRVHRAAEGDGVTGVVQARGVRSRSTKDGQTLESVDRAEGEIKPGDYLFLVVYGPAQVKADATSGAIAAGTRLAAGRVGAARALRTVTVGGIAVAEAAPGVGTALEALQSGTGLISVFVTLH
jgi:hypothetical protein